jgi:beta-glucosidase
VLQLFYGGEETGHGLWDVLLGRLSPSARMPETTFVDEYLSLVGPVANFNMITQGVGRTYRFFNDSAAVAASGGAVSSYLRYRFGYGLSYCPRFTYSGLSVALNSSSGGLQLAVSVAAAAPEPVPAGLSSCREVTQVYLTLPAVAGLATPLYSLVAFASTELQPGGAPAVLSLSVSREDLLTTAADGSRSLTGGDYLLQVSGHLPDDELGAQQSNVLRQSISLAPAVRH